MAERSWRPNCWKGWWFMQCRVCGVAGGHLPHSFKNIDRETTEWFPYFECRGCGCLQIEEIPESLASYYPDEYYSYAIPVTTLPVDELKKSPVKNTMRAAFEGMLCWSQMESLVFAGTPREARILDVGSGGGVFVAGLRQAGYQNVLGIDPFLKNDVALGNGVQVLRRDLDEVDGKWDVVTFHHSFEHVPDPLDTLRKASAVLSESGRCLLRLPIFPSAAWQEYGGDWIGLDPPRHLYIHTLQSLRMLAAKSGMRVESVTYDSTGLQFWGSQQRRLGIPLHSARSLTRDPLHAALPVWQLWMDDARAQVLNAQRKGDTVAVWLRRSDH